MTAKEYLNQARHLDALINCRLREIDYWRDLSSSVSGMKFDGMPHSPNRPTEAPFVRCLEKIDEIQRDVEDKVAYLVRLKEEINTAIDMLASRDRSARCIAYTGRLCRILSSRIESWHGLARNVTIDLWYDYNSKVE